MIHFNINKTRTFDNRSNGHGGTNHACHHHSVTAFGTLHKNQKDFRCGSMSEDLNERSHNCRFEFSSDLTQGRKFVQTKGPEQCESKFKDMFIFFPGFLRFMEIIFEMKN
jgi:hypothetical protein